MKYPNELRYDTGPQYFRQGSFESPSTFRMSFFLDLFPLAAFFVAFKLKGILVATGVLMAATLIQLTIHWVRFKEVKKMYLVTAIVAVVFGSLTIYLKDPLYIQWKFTIVYWIFSLTFFTSIWWGKAPLVQTLLEAVIKEGGAGDINIPRTTWHKVNVVWVLMFFALGAVNIYVFKNFSQETWVDFKVIWATAAFFVFIAGNVFWLFRHLPQDSEET